MRRSALAVLLLLLGIGCASQGGAASHDTVIGFGYMVFDYTNQAHLKIFGFYAGQFIGGRLTPMTNQPAQSKQKGPGL